jgi:hypothetical protein
MCVMCFTTSLSELGCWCVRGFSLGSLPDGILVGAGDAMREEQG